jgi:hypothetical protein
MSEHRIPRYQELEKPEFKSAIPLHLVNKLSEQEQYLVGTLSRMEAQNEWLIRAVLESNRSIIETDLRVQDVQDWKSMISSKWAVIVVFILMCIPVALKALLERLWK